MKIDCHWISPGNINTIDGVGGYWWTLGTVIEVSLLLLTIKKDGLRIHPCAKQFHITFLRDCRTCDPTVTLYHRLWVYGAAGVTVVIVSLMIVMNFSSKR